MEKNYAPQAAMKFKMGRFLGFSFLQTAVILVLSILLQSCSSEEVSPLDLQVQPEEQNEGTKAIYKGIFAGKAGNRGTVQIDFYNIVNANYSEDESAKAVLHLASGESFEAELVVYKSTARSASDLYAHFDSEDLAFDFFIDDTNIPVVSNVVFKKEEGAIIVAEHTAENPVTPVTGTYNCTNCDDKNSEVNGIELNNSVRTFNLLLSSQNGQAEVTVQAALGDLVSTNFVVQESCTTVGEFTFCTYKSSADLHDPVVWSGVHRYRTDAAAANSCSSLFGNLIFNSDEAGTIEAEFVSDSSCSTTTYYVSASGDDNNTGLAPQDAWRTTQKVNSVDLRPGDVVLLEGGSSFDGGLFLDSNDANDPAKPVKISSYGSGKASINAGHGIGIKAYNTAGIEISNLNIQGTWNLENKNSGIEFYNDLPGNIKLDYIRINNVEVQGFQEYGIVIGGYNGISGFNDVIIENSKVHNIGFAGISSYGYFSATKTGYAHSNLVVRHCEVFNIIGYDRGGHAGNGIVLADVQHSRIEYSTVYNSGSGSSFGGGGPVGIWYWDSDDVVIQFNEVYGMQSGSNKDGGGFDLDGGVTNGIMQYNYSHDNEGAGFLIGQFTGARPMNNITVRYNISENDASTNGGSVYLFNGAAPSSMKNIYVYQNTFYISDPSAHAIKLLQWQTISENVNFYNNILYATNGAGLVSVPGGYEANFQGNLYFSPTEVKIDYKGKRFTSLESFRSTGNETLDGLPVGFQGDPMLNNPGNGGTIGFGQPLSELQAYKLNSNSPAMDAGIDLSFSEGTRDFYGNDLQQNAAPEIGAHAAVDQTSIAGN